MPPHSVRTFGTQRHFSENLESAIAEINFIATLQHFIKGRLKVILKYISKILCVSNILLLFLSFCSSLRSWNAPLAFTIFMCKKLRSLSKKIVRASWPQAVRQSWICIHLIICRIRKVSMNITNCTWHIITVSKIISISPFQLFQQLWERFKVAIKYDWRKLKKIRNFPKSLQLFL